MAHPVSLRASFGKKYGHGTAVGCILTLSLFMSNRIEILKQMLDVDPGNSFARYGLAMENLNTGDLEASVLEFETLLENDPSYSAAYFHGGQTLEKLGRLDDARNYYRRGLAVTRDAHARGELQVALDILGE
jgi:tetratricopeptide (TPR) repeat protein